MHCAVSTNAENSSPISALVFARDLILGYWGGFCIINTLQVSMQLTETYSICF